MQMAPTLKLSKQMTIQLPNMNQINMKNMTPMNKIQIPPSLMR